MSAFKFVVVLCIQRKGQAIRIVVTTVCRRLGGIGRDRRGVTGKSDGMAGSIRDKGSQSKCKLNRKHGMHTRR